MRMYYTDPLKAAIMTRDFGIRFKGWEGCEAKNEDGRAVDYPSAIILWASRMENPLLEVHESHYHHFEPQEWDTIEHDNLPGLITTKQGFIPNLSYSLEVASNFIKTGNAEIIQRQGKAFFWPEVEND